MGKMKNGHKMFEKYDFMKLLISYIQDTRYKIIFHQKEFTMKLQNHIKIYRFMKIYSNLLALNIPHIAKDSHLRIALTVYIRY